MLLKNLQKNPNHLDLLLLPTDQRQNILSYLLEGVPQGVNLKEIAEAITARVPEVRNVHHLHAWALTAEKPLLTLHASIDDQMPIEGVISRMKAVLNDDFGIDHSTIQVEHGPCPDD